MTKNSNSGAAAGAGAIYGLGMLGALVYFWQQADVWWEYLFSFVQAVLWPAWMVYDLFQVLN
ncbi:MAG TPA: hypothetical protein VMT88_11715 [Actinomycetes bacterium]|nr:hypothetical protein [Actinomycetes bacterium]